METNRITLVKELADSIDSEIYCNLLDKGFAPGEAWNATFESGFDLVKDVATNG